MQVCRLTLAIEKTKVSFPVFSIELCRQAFTAGIATSKLNSILIIAGVFSQPRHPTETPRVT
ncbi:hypothetical protein [Nostoc sp. ChiQUE01b]|uniref:hypothetical protein n=1 Tax=Nostoc sp. ChiQUE01b TaxID=3075376 RepID=UPI002AD410AB|nr:hypothetical protein [Nostoc sp. ChiQUE01b]MDZ8264464.1 hypothetical protein [Nostoc sp. ChiQUE01b]